MYPMTHVVDHDSLSEDAFINACPRQVNYIEGNDVWCSDQATNLHCYPPWLFMVINFFHTWLKVMVYTCLPPHYFPRRGTVISSDQQLQSSYLNWDFRSTKQLYSAFSSLNSSLICFKYIAYASMVYSSVKVANKLESQCQGHLRSVEVCIT